ncbi:MAG: calcium-binding protein [Hasllibacter sp.]
MPGITSTSAIALGGGTRLISDMELLQGGASPRVAVLDRESGRVTVLRLDGTEIEQIGQEVAHGLDPLGQLRLGVVTIDGRAHVTVAGDDGAVEALEVSHGRLDGGARTIATDGAGAAHSSAGAGMPDFVRTAEGGGLACLEFRAGALSEIGTMADDEATYAADVHLAAVADDVLITVSAEEDGLTFWRARGDEVQAYAALGAEEGLGIASPSAIEVVETAGAAFAVLAASGSSSLTVLRLDGAGLPVPADHLIDTPDSRFGGVSALAAAEVDGRAYLLAGGSDGGVTLLAMMPGGRLVTLDAVDAVGGAAIGNVTALEMAEIEGVLRAVVTTQTGQLLRLDIDLGPIGETRLGAGTLSGGARDDFLEGGGGDDAIHGGGGDDTIRDGGGADTMRGGAGRDTFILAYDAATDVIADFEAGLDRLDLSEWPLLYGASQMTWTTVQGGIVLTARGESVRILSRDGGALTLEQVLAGGFLDGFRVLPDVPPHGVVVGPDGPDLGTPGDDDIQGTYEDDIIAGGAGDDRLAGGDGNDRLLGEDGGDTLLGGGGDDLLIGGNGDDVLLDPEGSNTLEGGAGDDFLRGGAAGDRLEGGGGADAMHALGGDDRMFGGEGDDRMMGGDGGDLLRGEGGGDLMRGEGGHDRLFGGDGADSLYGDGGDDTLVGEGGDDHLSGGAGDDFVHGGDGDDTVLGGGGDDRLLGGNGNDALLDPAGANTLDGGHGHDFLRGGAQRDVMHGGTGNDALHGLGGNDAMFGGAGADRMNAGPGADLMRGEAGDDLMRGQSGHDRLFGGAGGDSVYGDGGDDFLTAEGGDDFASGGDGNDFVHGGGGDDVLMGGAGDDRLIGGTGRDTLIGGPGADTFVFGPRSGRDVVTDFGGIDRIDLSPHLAGGLSAREIVETFAQQTRFGVVLDFGPDELVLHGASLDQLAGQIDPY